MTATFVHEAYGLRIDSDLELPLPQGAPGPPDIVVRAGRAAEASTGPIDGDDDTVVASYESDTGRWYVAALQDGVYRFRFRDCGEFVITEDLAAVRWIPQPQGRADLLPILFAGTVLSFVLTLRGHLVLHASAVATGEGALAFVGQSGRGKSTLAALTAAAGARIVTDDVLLVDVEHGARCRGNAGELRLRAGARELAASFSASAARRETADERLAVRLDRAEAGWVPLGAIVVPRPSRDADEVAFRRLSPSDAMLWLSSFPRVHGWRPTEVLRRQFELLGALARGVAVHDVVIPWGPPFHPDVASRLLGLLARPAP